MARVRELFQQMGEPPDLFPAIWGVWTYYYVRGDSPTARQLADMLLRMAQSGQEPARLLGAHMALGFTGHNMADLMACHQHLEQAIAWHDPRQSRAYTSLYSLDPGFYSRGLVCSVLWLLGYPDHARRRLHEALTSLEPSADCRSRAFTLVMAAFFYQYCREPEKILEPTDACIALCDKYDIAQERAWAVAFRGWALAEQGQVEEGISQVRESLDWLRAVDSESGLPQFLALLAEALGKAGRIEEGLAAVDEALHVIHQPGVGFYEAELHRIKGELLLQGSGIRDQGSDGEILPSASRQPPSEAEACFRQAIEVARHQQAKSFELRATMSLARLLRQLGRSAEARDRLAGVYGWFTEGFDTADLKDAQALLEELSA